MLKDLGFSFEPTKSCIHPIDPSYFNPPCIHCFDNDGFELTLLEQQYYKENHFTVNHFLNHHGCQTQWFSLDDPNFILDHSLLLERKSFDDRAREQIESYCKQFPQLLKYLKLKPKWGIDFALEYYSGDSYMEVLHIEYDFYDYDQALKAKEVFQTRLLATDWNDFVSSLIKKKDEWVNLKGFQQNDFKAKHWGLSKAEDTLKSFV